MPLPDQAIKEFQEAYLRDFDEELSREEARLVLRETIVFLRWLLGLTLE